MYDELDIRFLQEQTGIQDLEELKTHLFTIREGAYKVRCNHRQSRSVDSPGLQIYPWTCIRLFHFAKYIRIS